MAHHIVVCGAGIGGVPAAYAIKSRLGAEAVVTVIGKGDDFEFTPSNPWVALGWRSAGDIAFPVGPYLDARGIKFIPVPAYRIDPVQQRVILADDRAISYDFLILATGADAAFDGIPGMAHSTNVHSVMRTEDAVAAHAAYHQFVRNPGPIIVGATQDAAILGPVYELAFLIDADLRRRHLRKHAPITIVTPEPYPGHLGLGGDGETRRLLEQALKSSEIEFVGNAITESVERDHLHLSISGKDKLDITFSYSVYWPAFRGVAALRHSHELGDKQGRVLVDEFLRNVVHPQVFAVGLCVARTPLTSTPVPIGAPESVYSIQGEVDTVTQNVAASIGGQPLQSHVPRRTQWISDLGESGARFLAQPHVPLRDVNWLQRGAWVPLAKTDFERHFINKVKLGPRKAADTQVGALVAHMEAEHAQFSHLQDTPSVQRLGVPLREEQMQELEALAQALGQGSEQLASELLRAAIQDAEASLGQAARAALAQSRREVLIDRVTGNEPGVHFQGGAP